MHQPTFAEKKLTLRVKNQFKLRRHTAGKEHVSSQTLFTLQSMANWNVPKSFLLYFRCLLQTLCDSGRLGTLASSGHLKALPSWFPWCTCALFVTLLALTSQNTQWPLVDPSNGLCPPENFAALLASDSLCLPSVARAETWTNLPPRWLFLPRTVAEIGTNPHKCIVLGLCSNTHCPSHLVVSLLCHYSRHSIPMLPIPVTS